MLKDVIRCFLEEIKVYDIPGLTKTRFGYHGDGGYIVLGELCEKVPMLYSFGVGKDVSFERVFAGLMECPIHLYDHTIEMPTESNPNFVFHCVKASPECFRDNSIEFNSMLKMDIEWDEWEFFRNLRETDMRKFSQIIMEFHIVHAEPRSGLTSYFHEFYQHAFDEINEQLFSFYANVLKKVTSFFYCFHIHANNSLPLISVGGKSFPPLIEMSFVREDLAGEVKPTEQSFPIIGLDFPNKGGRPDLNLGDIFEK